MADQKPSFKLGQTVYMRISGEVPGMVTGILYRESGHLYYVTWAGDPPEEVPHFPMELTDEKSFSSG